MNSIIKRESRKYSFSFELQTRESIETNHSWMTKIKDGKESTVKMHHQTPSEAIPVSRNPHCPLTAFHYTEPPQWSKFHYTQLWFQKTQRTHQINQQKSGTVNQAWAWSVNPMYSKNVRSLSKTWKKFEIKDLSCLAACTARTELCRKLSAQCNWNNSAKSCSIQDWSRIEI